MRKTVLTDAVTLLCRHLEQTKIRRIIFEEKLTFQIECKKNTIKTFEYQRFVRLKSIFLTKILLQMNEKKRNPPPVISHSSEKHSLVVVFCAVTN